MAKLFTIGHSTRSIDEFIGLLAAHSITQLVDIRTIPRSRHNPQFGQEELSESLKKHAISYRYLKELGGLRPAVTDSVNDGWRNTSFRNYADYMQTYEFERGLEELITLSHQALTAIMCAEAVPWRCHRSLVSDALVVRDIDVYEIIGNASPRRHALTSFAVVEGRQIRYPKSALTEDESESP